MRRHRCESADGWFGQCPQCLEEEREQAKQPKQPTQKNSCWILTEEWPDGCYFLYATKEDAEQAKAAAEAYWANYTSKLPPKPPRYSFGGDLLPPEPGLTWSIREEQILKYEDGTYKGG